MENKIKIEELRKIDIKIKEVEHFLNIEITDYYYSFFNKNKELMMLIHDICQTQYNTDDKDENYYIGCLNRVKDLASICYTRNEICSKLMPHLVVKSKFDSEL